MNKPLIGVTSNEQPSVLDWGPKTYSQNHQYTDAILRAGGLPVILPFYHVKEDLRALYERLDAVLFTGGGDINPVEYGELDEGGLRNVMPDRDRIELQLVKWAVADDKPVLAICRGMQVLNVALGGTLIQHVDGHDSSTDKKDKTYVAHQLEIEPSSRLAIIIGGDPIGANSCHHQAIKKAAPGLSVTARADDQIVEAVELSRSRFCIGVQCHPESLVSTEPRWGRLFSAFVSAAESNTYASSASTRSSSITEALEAA